MLGLGARAPPRRRSARCATSRSTSSRSSSATRASAPRSGSWRTSSGWSTACRSTSTSRRRPALGEKEQVGALPDRPRVAEPGGPARTAVEDLGHDAARRRAGRSRRSSPTTAPGERRTAALDAIGERARDAERPLLGRAGRRRRDGDPRRPPGLRRSSEHRLESPPMENGYHSPGGHLLFVWSTSGWELQRARRRGPGRRLDGRGERTQLRDQQDRPVAAPGRPPPLRLHAARLAGAVSAAIRPRRAAAASPLP